MEDKLLTADEVCEALSVSQSTLKRIVAEGGIPMYKVRGSCRFFTSEVKAYVLSRQVSAAPSQPIPRPKRRYEKQRTCGYYPGMKVV